MTIPLPKIDNFRAHASGALRGHFDCELPSGMVLHGCALMVGAKGPWVCPPSRPLIGRDGAALTDANGKRRYEAAVSFVTREAADRFSALVLETLKGQHPEALA